MESNIFSFDLYWEYYLRNVDHTFKRHVLLDRASVSNAPERAVAVTTSNIKTDSRTVTTNQANIRRQFKPYHTTPLYRRKRRATILSYYKNIYIRVPTIDVDDLARIAPKKDNIHSILNILTNGDSDIPESLAEDIEKFLFHVKPLIPKYHQVKNLLRYYILHRKDLPCYMSIVRHFPVSTSPRTNLRDQENLFYDTFKSKDFLTKFNLKWSPSIVYRVEYRDAIKLLVVRELMALWDMSLSSFKNLTEYQKFDFDEFAFHYPPNTTDDEVYERLRQIQVKFVDCRACGYCKYDEVHCYKCKSPRSIFSLPI